MCKISCFYHKVHNWLIYFEYAAILKHSYSIIWPNQLNTYPHLDWCPHLDCWMNNIGFWNYNIKCLIYVCIMHENVVTHANYSSCYNYTQQLYQHVLQLHIIKYLVGIDMKIWLPNFTHLETHLLESYTWEKPTEMHFWCYNNIALVLNSKNLSSLSYREFWRFQPPPTFHLSACVRPTSASCMGPVFSQKNGDSRLKNESVVLKNVYLGAIACPLVFHSMDLSLLLQTKV